MSKTIYVAAMCLLSLYAAAASANDPIVVKNLVASVIDQVDVPATELGVLQTLSVREGSRVTKGQTIGKLDDREVAIQTELANIELEIATKLSDNHLGDQLAQKDLLQQEQLAEQQLLLREIARRKAANDLKVKAAHTVEGVAKSEYLRANKARERFTESVSKSELDALRLSYEKAILDSKQARFESEIDNISAKSEEKATVLQQLKVDQAQITLKQANTQKDVVSLQAKAKKQALSLAKLSIERHRIIAPFDGMIVQRYQQQGQWVKPGDPVVRVVRLNRLRAEGVVPVETANLLRRLKKVELTATLGDQVLKRDGEVTYVSPEINPVDGQVRVLIEFDNPKEDILPGSLITVTVQ